MAVRLRLKRMGRKNLPFFRLCAFDSRTRRDGRAIEELGHYDPLIDAEDKKYTLNRDRITYWLSVGAKPTVTVQSILLRNGIAVPGAGKPAMSPEEKAQKEKEREHKKAKREETLARKAAVEASASKLSKKEKREAKKAGA
ncbi:MAG TPA: 30S ribosomal protein S16 [Planctomycetota bacterium]|nr:30S ribosomal protein S16 [Planctomycetota bacterium]